MSVRQVCVTGGAGFIGSHLSRRLLQEGLRVRILDNLATGTAANLPPEAEFLRGDALNPDDCRRAVSGCDVVVHLAARVAIRSSFDFVVEDAMTNVCGTASVLRAAAQSGSVRKVLFASSMAVYADAPSPRPIPETHPTVPLSPYGISKLAGEQLTHTLAAKSGMKSVVLRLFNTYGTGQQFSPYVGVVTIFAKQLSRGEQPVIYGDGEQARDFVHVSDVVEGFVCALRAELSGETFNIGSGRPTTVNEVYATVARVAGAATPPVHADAVAGELRYSVADISKARAMLGYEPSHRFDLAAPAVIRSIMNGEGARP
ncbi:MAG TPA: NAD-dependent epimerase/dehydratase family protein [Terriglobia bacterium]|nr:NAD-dependent epimerase/dehydratase family protein [Terriglobia bacterium]